MKIEETPVTGDNPYVFVEWDKDRQPEVILGGFTLKVHLPDLIERVDHLGEQLRELQRKTVRDGKDS